MILDPKELYAALLTRDGRFDGRFFVGVTSTRVYCRPVCSVRTPLEKNCKFFISAAAAEAGGFRPCRRCSPELSPGLGVIDASGRLARQAGGLVQEGFLEEHSLEDLAEKLGVTGRHLRRIFRDEFGVSPVEYAQTHRLLLAKQMLGDARLSVTEIAYACGFQSLRRFNALYLSRYRMSPSGFRKRGQADEGPGDQVIFRAGYRRPYDFPGMLTFLHGRAIPGVELADDSSYTRTARFDWKGKIIQGIIQVSDEPERACLRIGISRELLPACSRILELIKHLFDTAAEPHAIAATLSGLTGYDAAQRVPGCFDPFEMIVRAILGQQISVKAAQTLAGRFAKAFGMPFGGGALGVCFPSPAALKNASVEEVRKLGITGKRAATILDLAERLASGRLVLDPRGSVEDTLDQLRQTPGIGEWTAQYVALRALRWPDAFPHTDLGVQKAMGLKSSAAILKAAECWRPWRGYAVLHLWKTLTPILK